jgi:prefoldin alpha subunit
MESNQQEVIYKLSMLQQQAQQVQEQIQVIDQNILELNSLISGLEDLKGKEGNEVLAPLGRGIFVKSKILSERLTVDVGGKNFVIKSIPETEEIVMGQIKKVEEAKKQMLDELERLNGELMNLIKEAEAGK